MGLCAFDGEKMSGMANGRVRKWNLRLLIWCALVFVATGFLLWGAWEVWGALWFGNLSAADQAVGRATSALTTVGGLGGAVFLTVRYREHSLAERQEERDVIAAQRQALVDATRLLDSDVASTRIAGVTILAEIADTYRGNYRQQVVDILCGYLRTNHKDEEKGHDPAVESAIMNTIAAHLKKPPTDIPILPYEKILAAWRKGEDERYWCECTFDFHNAVFAEIVDFRGATFSKSVNFCEASFTGRAHFRDAWFTGDIGFWSACFNGNADFQNVKFDGDTDFRNAQLAGKGSFLSAQFIGNANFDNAWFDGTASFRQAKFADGAQFDQAKFTSGANFRQTTFADEGSFRQTTFTGRADFSAATFTDDATFDHATFIGGAHFRRTTLAGFADFSVATFTDGASFLEATFTGRADFSEVTFSSDANFWAATFSGGADFYWVTFSGDSSFRQATFTCADFDMVKGNIKINEATGLPDGAVWKSTEDRS